MTEPGRPTPLLPGLTILLFAACATTWSLVIPPFETPDEPGHARYVNFLRERGRLPVPGSEASGEAHQPPLYYALAAGAAAALGLEPVPVAPARNPAFRWYGGLQENKYLHPAAESNRPLSILRLFSVILAAGTVATIFWMAVGSGLLSWRGASLAAAFAAFLPQFTFVSGSLNNDNLANLLSAVALGCLVAALGGAPRRAWWGLAGAATGLGLLAKFTGLAMIPCGIAALWAARRRGGAGGSRRDLAAAAALFLLPALGIPAPLLIRNTIALGDPLGASAQVRTLPNLLDPKTPLSDYFLGEFPVVLFESFWGRFGWMSFRMPGWYYLAALAATLAAAAGLLMRLGRRPMRGSEGTPPGLLWLLAAAVVFQVGQVALYNLSFTQAQGRFLFPVLGPIVILFGAGLAAPAGRLSGARWTDRAALVAIVAMAGANLALLATLVRPAYRIAAALP